MMELHILVCDLAFCGSIAVPGGVTAGPILLFVGNRFFEKHQGTSDYLAEAVRKARELGWPTIRKLSIIDVWNWIISIPEFKLKVGRGKVGRAVAAFVTDFMGNGLILWDYFHLVSTCIRRAVYNRTRGNKKSVNGKDGTFSR